MSKASYPARKYAETPVASASRTASGDSGSLGGFGAVDTIRAQIEVTATSGTSPTLDVVIEDTLDGGDTWNTIATFAQLAANGREVLNVAAPFGDRLRVSWTIGGTSPAFTFEVKWIVAI